MEAKDVQVETRAEEIVHVCFSVRLLPVLAIDPQEVPSGALHIIMLHVLA